MRGRDEYSFEEGRFMKEVEQLFFANDLSGDSVPWRLPNLAISMEHDRGFTRLHFPATVGYPRLGLLYF